MRINNLQQQEGQVIILGTDGRILIRTMITRENPEISISVLTRGIYILKAGNHAVKFIKQ